VSNVKVKMIKEGIDALVSCWVKAVEVEADYVQKLHMQYNHIVFP